MTNINDNTFPLENPLTQSPQRHVLRSVPMLANLPFSRSVIPTPLSRHQITREYNKILAL